MIRNAIRPNIKPKEETELKIIAVPILANIPEPINLPKKPEANPLTIAEPNTTKNKQVKKVSMILELLLLAVSFFLGGGKVSPFIIFEILSTALSIPS